MKNVLGLTLLLLAAAVQADPKVLGDALWETGDLRTPESVLVHQLEGRKVLLVSEIEGQDPTEADGKGGIALLDTDGTIIDQDFIRGLSAPKGMAVQGNTLYVSDITELVAIDLSTQKILERHPIAGSTFLNDVAVADNGAVYVSDTNTGKVHRLLEGKVDTYLEGMSGANGLYTDGDALYIGAGPELYVARDGETTLVAEGFASGIDGIEALADGGFVVSCWVGLLYHVSEKGEITQLLDSREEGIHTADIGYDKETGTVYIPTFFTHSVRAHSL